MAEPHDDDPDAALAEFRSQMSIDGLRRNRLTREALRSESSPASVVMGSVGRDLTVVLTWGEYVTGQVLEAGRDYVCIETSTITVWLRTAGLVAVRTSFDPADAATEVRPLDSGLVDVLHDLMATEADIMLAVRGGTRLAGRPIAVGRSITLRDDQGYTVTEIDDITVVTVSRSVRAPSPRRHSR